MKYLRKLLAPAAFVAAFALFGTPAAPVTATDVLRSSGEAEAWCELCSMLPEQCWDK